MPKKIDVLLGLQYGDEGKGKHIDTIAQNYDIIARFNGGPNAGHTIEKYVLHSIPSGIFARDTMNLVGAGVIIDPESFMDEFLRFEKVVPGLQDKIVIAREANLILPTHKILDLLLENHKSKSLSPLQNQPIGTTGKGIGPTYRDKTGRDGLRIGWAVDNWSNFHFAFMHLFETHMAFIRGLNAKFAEENVKEMAERNKIWLEALEKMVSKFSFVHCSDYVNSALDKDKKILAEGAQAALLDVDWGSYPFVTSSSATTAGVCTGLGVHPKRIGRVMGVFKAYVTRVGEGPFPTELGGEKSAKWCREANKQKEEQAYFKPDVNSVDEFEQGVALRFHGREYGSTTGRPRRTGWLDLPALRYAIKITGTEELVMTKLDILRACREIKVAVSHKKNGEIVPFDPCMTYDETNYKILPGFRTTINNLPPHFSQLPKDAQVFIKFLEKELGVPIKYISMSADRGHMIERKVKMAKA
jgi:adenylosuccinate synthase